ncbi:DUF1707 SHOCT-like domain-containing protein [Actinomycetospora atypica]|uniref:DUF1707 domain-containing protein n=1 Tax=Actinomycetospora atypica TaxID=1290095 RepID=A0ABV9YFZ8_9PSEU
MSTSRKRARDADRTATCDVLDAAFAEGQLDGVEHRERTAAAIRARTVGELHDLVEDLQAAPRPGPPPPMPPERVHRRRPGRLLALLVVGVSLAVVVVGLSWQSERGAVRAGPSADPDDVPARVVGPVNLHSEEGWRRLVGDLQDSQGSALVHRVLLYPGYAVLELPVPGEPARSRSYTYRGGLGSSNSASSHDPQEPPVDLAAIDPRPLLALLAGVDRSVNVRDVTTRYLSLEDDGDGDGPVAAIHASNEFNESGYLSARPDGSIVGVWPYEPG